MNAEPLIIGVDVGASGAIAEFWPGNKIMVHPMMEQPDLRDYFAEVARIASLEGLVLHCFIEQVGGYIGRPQPGSMMFKFGFGAGFIHGLLAANHITTHLVTPQKWQKGLSGVDGLKGPDRKRALRAEAARRFPNVKTTLSTCDALLIAEYGKRTISCNS
jgi:hypothetical protein